MELELQLEIAIERMLQYTKEKKSCVMVSLMKSLGKRLAKEIIAPIDQPPFHRSPLDGYAFSHTDVQILPATLPIEACVYAGDTRELTLTPGHCTKIMTGAKLPKGATCVARQEEVHISNNRVTIHRTFQEYENYCFAGEDVKKGTVVMKEGEVITSVHLGIMASLGIESVLVYEPLKIALISTGDELVTPGQPLQSGKIYNSNLYLLAGRLAELGYAPAVMNTISDEDQSIADTIKSLEEMDVIFTTGGVSVGEKDRIQEVLRSIGGNSIFWKVALKPGTPVLFSKWNEIPILSFSGNPFAALANFELLGRVLLSRVSGISQLVPKVGEAVMGDEFLKPSITRRFIRGRYQDGIVTLPKGSHASGVLGSMLGCNCLIDIPSGTKGLAKGDQVTIQFL